MLEGLALTVQNSKTVQALVKKQKDTGLWGGNLMALAPSAKDGIKDIGTLAQHRPFGLG